jgi:transposase, IS30 family
MQHPVCEGRRVVGNRAGHPKMLRRVQKQLWEALYRGATHVEVARLIGVSGHAVRREVRSTGGIRPRIVLIMRVDPTRRSRCLSEVEREHIALRWMDRAGVREIARELCRDPGTISRELRRNGFTRSGYYPDGHPRGRWQYRPLLAQAHAEERRRRPKARKLAGTPRLADHVQTQLDQRWSPRQIARRLPREFPEDPEMRVSHETIYQSLYVQGRGGLRADLHHKLRTGRALRKPQAATRRKSKRTTIPDLVSISDRPAEVADRAVPGHWEGDLIIGKDKASAIGTLVERSTRYCLLLHLPEGYSAEKVRDAMITTITTLPQHLWRSLTWDRGLEMVKHREITIATGLPIYFCDPRSPWQRGSNENTNGLLRQYFPKSTDLSVHSADHLTTVAIELNGRPRETLNWDTPAEALNRLLSKPFNTTGVATTP